MNIKYWENKKDLEKIKWIKKYNKACDKFYKNSPDEIAYLYSYFSLEEHESFIREISDKINLNLKGNGLEIGSGPGILSYSIIQIHKNIKKIILLDKVPNVVKLQKKLVDHLGFKNKIDSVIGDFNDLKLENNSLDFILDFDSIHHSDDFDLTFKEISRVLKKDGILLCFDRGQPNYISKKHIDYLLNIEYNDQYKIENGIKLTERFTRTMNGEHEPYLNDWINTGKKYNLGGNVFIFHKKSFKNLIRSIYGLTPLFFRKIFNKGYNITTHYQLILSYLGISNFNGIRTFSMEFNPIKSKTPEAKMVFLFKKLK